MPRIEMVKLRIGWVAVVINDLGGLPHARWWFTAEGAWERCARSLA